ncbi:hypothetical protein PC110_g5884 [Phytophthora cactorum]|uniref:Uncharacterized protein n=1 Tax=Phytophthora cactorum TaxID=29920 RepID=A0A329SME8_9STRA|nr:hypothetical protein PC111_g20517 [Phytophthora cactorum]KAG2886021.1 hypothetical protein PC114_g19475 [Phytophthora cactorum]KAG2886456.1 hypothetical protein PC115_g20680 [Phytophthora cactorum]KAG3057271.1 hypothetical protein PC122_g21096 [Phytophthora cactorum]KAG4045518.1 hypothetical protein PC123_g19080 [Phytophthora cactorum]
MASDGETDHDQITGDLTAAETAQKATSMTSTISSTLRKDEEQVFNAVLTSVKSSFDDDLQTTLCDASWGVTNDALTGECVLEKIHAIKDSYQNQVLPPVNELFWKELKMNMSIPGILSRVADYLVKMDEKVENEIEYRFPDTRASVLKLSNLINQQVLEQAIVL